MCKMCYYLFCCCECLFVNRESKSYKEKDVSDRRKFKPALEESSDSEIIKSSTDNEFDRYHTKTSGEQSIKEPKEQIRFTSPPNALEDRLESHRIRLPQRGFKLTSDTPIASGIYSSVFVVTRVVDGEVMACKVTKYKELHDSTVLLREVFMENAKEERQALHLNTSSLSSRLTRRSHMSVCNCLQSGVFRSVSLSPKRGSMSLRPGSTSWVWDGLSIICTSKGWLIGTSSWITFCYMRGTDRQS